MSRSLALPSQDITLTIMFFDSSGAPKDPDVLNNVLLDIYPPGFDPREPATLQTDAWVYDISLIGIGLGPEAVAGKFLTHPSTGHFEYIFTVPAAAPLGDAYDYWRGVVDGQNLTATLSFNVGQGGEITSTEPPLYQNNAVYFRILSTVADNDDGTLLGADYTWYFSTTYNPLYEGIRRIRLDMGSLVTNIPDDTINLAIFEASIEADAFSFGSITLSPYFLFARRQYVACTAEMILLHALLGASSDGGGGKSKTLADLKISTTGGSASEGGLLGRVLACRLKWEAILTSSGEIGPGTSQKPSMVVKGTLDPDRPLIGRGWEPTSSWNGQDSALPAANTDVRWIGKRRPSKSYVHRSRWNSRFI